MKREKRHNSRKRFYRRAIAVGALALVLAVAVFVLLPMLEQEEDNKVLADQSQEEYMDGSLLIRYDGKWYKQNPAIKTLLLIGVDGFESAEKEMSQQADFLLVILINSETKTYQMLQLNRDTIADVPQLDLFGQKYGTKRQQLALAYAYGDRDTVNCRNTVEAVSNFLYGVSIDHYVKVGMDAVPMWNDLVGGVSVRIEDDFSNVDPTLEQGKEITLTGQQALTFVRARSSMQEPTNVARMERQKQYMHAFHTQAIAKAKSDTDFIMRSLLESSSYFTSDCSINQLSEFFNIALEQESSEILSVAGEAAVGQEYMEFHADEAALQKQVIDLFFTEDTLRN